MHLKHNCLKHLNRLRNYRCQAPQAHPHQKTGSLHQEVSMLTPCQQLWCLASPWCNSQRSFTSCKTLSASHRCWQATSKTRLSWSNHKIKKKSRRPKRFQVTSRSYSRCLETTIAKRMKRARRMKRRISAMSCTRRNLLSY